MNGLQHFMQLSPFDVDMAKQQRIAAHASTTTPPGVSLAPAETSTIPATESSSCAQQAESSAVLPVAIQMARSAQAGSSGEPPRKKRVVSKVARADVRRLPLFVRLPREDPGIIEEGETIASLDTLGPEVAEKLRTAAHDLVSHITKAAEGSRLKGWWGGDKRRCLYSYVIRGKGGWSSGDESVMARACNECIGQNHLCFFIDHEDATYSPRLVIVPRRNGEWL